MRSSTGIYKHVRRDVCRRQKLECGLSNLFPILCLAVHVYSTGAYEKSHRQFCRYWCRTIDHRYYCCPSGKAENWPEYIWRTFFHPWFWMHVDESSPFDLLWPEIFDREEKTTKHCPPLRTYCPRTYDWYSPPSSCADDDDCDEWKKCCYDVCLGHKVCKYAE